MTTMLRSLLQRSQTLSPSLAALATRRAQATTSTSLTYGYPQSLLNVPETRVTTLPTGLRVATENLSLDTATVGVFIDSGSRSETDANNGVAHFLEHMAFKGTSKRSQQSLETEVESMGARLFAFTSREQTIYLAKVLKKDIGYAVDLLADILQNPTLAPAAIENERGVILRENDEVNKNYQEVVLEHLHATAFQGNALARPILGSIGNIKSISRDQLNQYITKNYTAPRMVVAASGGVDHDSLVSLSEKAFAKLPSINGAEQQAPARFVGSEIRIRNDEMTEAHIGFAVEGCSWSSPDYFPLLVAQTVVGAWDRTLGGGDNLSSNLARVIAKNKLANSFMAFNTCYSDTGLFGMYITSEAREHLDDLMYAVQQEWVRLATGVTEAEVERARNQLKTAMLMQLDGTSAITEDIGRQMLVYGRRMTPFEIDARIQAVDAATVRAAAYKYLYDRDPAIVAIGPIESFSDYNRIQTATSWLRI